MNNKSAWILSFGLIVAALVFGVFFYGSRQTDQTVRVVGYSTYDFEANIVKWSFTFSETVPTGNLTTGYQTMNNRLQTLKRIWNELAISYEDFNIQPITVRKMYGQYGKIEGDILEQNIFIISKDLDAIENLAINPVDFTKEGLAFEYSNMQYFSTDLPDIKMKLLGDATENAIERANEIAKSTGSKVKEITSARTGVFQITEPYSTEFSDYGMYQTSTRKKSIRVTVTCTFTVK